jgi:hypothetical protein
MNPVAKLKIDKWIIELQCDRQKLLPLRVGSLCGVTIKPDEPILIGGRHYPFVVFPTRVTPTHDLEQTSEGIACDDEASATSFAELINGKNRTVPHVGLMSAPGFFGIATASNVDLVRPQLDLFRFRVAKMDNGKPCGFALRYQNYFLDKSPEVIWEELLPTTELKTARKLKRKKQAELDAKEADARAIFEKGNAAAKAEPNLTAMRLEVLAKAYPDTVAFLKNPNPANAEAVFAAYQRETFVLTGRMDGTLPDSERLKTAKAMINAIRRKNPAINEVEYQLVAGWRLRGYDRMTPQQRYDDLKSLGLQPASPEAIRKICERLKLPSQRKPGERSNSNTAN